MGRNKTPTAILEAKGAFIHDPQRARPDEPTTDRPLGGPPKYLNKEEKKVWKDIAALALPGVMLESDRIAFEMIVRLVNKQRQDLPMMFADRSLLLSLLSRFAMTPADRSRVVVQAPKESALDKFRRKREVKPDTTEASPEVIQ